MDQVESGNDYVEAIEKFQVHIESEISRFW